MTRTATVRRQVAVGLRTTITEFLREPVNLALIVVLPPIVVASYGSMMGALPKLPAMTTSPETMGAINGAMYVAAFLPGVIGLFQVISARRADERLQLGGFRQSVLFLARCGTVLLASAVAAVFTMAVLLATVAVSAPLLAWAVLVLVGLTYGLVGMLVGSVLPRELEGSLLLVFVADLDEAMASGLFRTDAVVTKLLPLHFPHDVFTAAVDGGRLPAGDVLYAGTYAIVLFALVFVAHGVLTGTGGGT